MKHTLIIQVCILLGIAVVQSPSAQDHNERLTLTHLGGQSFAVTWWAREGVYYLVDVSEDLQSWSYMQMVYLGSGSESSPIYLHHDHGDRLFVRLNTTPFETDADGDGMSDGWEVQHGLNARFSGDAGLDPDGDGLSNLEEAALSLDPHWDQYGSGQRTHFFAYDASGRLTQVVANQNESFSYDADSNITLFQ